MATLNNANFLIAIPSNYGSVLLSFLDITMWRTPDKWQTNIGNNRISGP